MAPPEYAADPLSWTLPNARGVLPPPATRNLRAAHFQPPQQRVRGDFVPTGTHDLAAHRLIPYLTSPEGTHEPPMSYVLRVRQEFTFNSAPAIAIAAYSARFGRHGLTIMHCKRVDRAARLRAGSTDANFNVDFGSNISPPPAPKCTSYFDLLSAVQGLTSFANAHWYEPMAPVMYRLREFVTANMDADPAHSADRVERTLDEVNRFLGDAFAPLASDSPYWWREFSAATAQIEFSSVAWSLALAELAQAPARPAAPAHVRNARPPSAPAPDRHAHARTVSERPAGIPEHIRRLIPRDADGIEPCLKFFGGGMCTGGSRSTCTAPGRTHVWPSTLPDALTTFITQRFGGRRAFRSRRS